MILIKLIIFFYFVLTGIVNSANNLWYEKDDEKQTYVFIMGFLTGWYIFPQNFIKGLIKDLKERTRASKGRGIGPRIEEEIKAELSFFEGYLAGMNDDWSLDEKEVKSKIQALEFVLEESEVQV